MKGVLFGRFTRITVDILGTLLVLVLIGAAVLGWRLSLGPLSLKFLTPMVERALSDENMTVDIDDTVLAWGGWQRTFDVRVRGVRALDNEGRLMAELPEVSVSFSARGFLHGLVAPTSLDAIGARIVLVHTVEGVWRFRASAETADERPSALPLLLEDLLAPPDPSRSLGYLRGAGLYESSLTVIDEASGQAYVARDANITFARDEGGLRAHLSAVADIAGKSTRMSADAHYYAASGLLEAAVDVVNLDPTAFASLSPPLKPLAGLNLALNGRVTLGFDPQFHLAQAGFDITGENGRLERAALNLPQPAEIRRLHLRGRMPEGLTAVDIDEAQLDLGGPTIGLRGRVEALDAAPRATGALVIRNVPTDTLRQLWPVGAAANARAWITENLSRGMIGEARAEFAAGAAEPSAKWTVERLNGTLRFAGVEVNYLTPMPHVQAVDGDAKFTQKRFDITLAGGGLGNLHVPQGTIALTALDTNDEMADVDVSVAGPLREVLDLIDGPPLGYLKKIDLRPDAFAGDSTVRLKLKFPLKKTIKLEEIDVLATAEAHHLTQRQAALGQDISDGDITLQASREGMTIAGRVKLGPTTADIDLRRNFSDRAAIIGETRARGRIGSAEDRAAFGFDLAPYVKGPTDVAVIYVERRGGRSDVTVDAGLTGATMEVAELDWSKPPGDPATAHLVVDLAGGQAKAIRSFNIAAGDPANGGLIAAGRLEFGADGRTITRVDFDTLKAPLTDARGTYIRSPDRMSVEFVGPALNAGPLLRDSSKPPSAQRLPLSLRVEVDRVYFANDRWLNQFLLQGQRGSQRWETADLVGETGDGHGNNQVRLTLQKFGERQTLNMIADDAGAFFKALDVTPNVVGGRLEINGATDEKRPGRPIAGHLHVSEYRVAKAPMLARVLSVALLTGIVDSLTGEGIRFSQLDADYVYDGSRIEILNAQSAGSAVGLTAKGIVDLDADSLDITGTLVPANALNSLPAKIPVIGDILVGRGGGLFAATYKLSGPMSDAKATVNPLSTIAPGFLRNLFGNLPGKSAEDATPESEKEIQREQPKPAAPPDQNPPVKPP